MRRSSPPLHRFAMQLIGCCVLPIALAEGVAATDLGMFDGEPSPALAMYAAQVNFAENECIASGFVRDGKDLAKFVKYFNNGTQLRRYQSKAVDFALSFDASSATYRSAWQQADQVVRAKFCEGFAADIAKKKSQGFFHWAAAIGYFRDKFSPLSEASAKRKRRIGSVVAVVGGVAATAATLSAGEDAVSSAKAGDWTTSNQQMAASRSFIQTGAALGRFPAHSADSVAAGPLVSVFEEPAPGGTSRIVRCPVVDHFSNYSAPSDSPIWLTYQSVSVTCRDPKPSDTQRVQ